MDCQTLKIKYILKIIIFNAIRSCFLIHNKLLANRIINYFKFNSYTFNPLYLFSLLNINTLIANFSLYSKKFKLNYITFIFCILNFFDLKNYYYYFF